MAGISKLGKFISGKSGKLLLGKEGCWILPGTAAPLVVALAEAEALAVEVAGFAIPAHLHAANASLVALATAGLISCREKNT
jgi:hypothetical protein